MGMGMFAGRKIALLNQINNFEMMIMNLSSKQMRLTDKAAQLTLEGNNSKLNLTSIGMQMQGYNCGGGAQNSNPWGLVGGSIGAAGMATAGIMNAAGASNNTLNWTGAVTGALGAGAAIAGGIFSYNHGVGAGMSGAGNSYMSALQGHTNIENQLTSISQMEKRVQMQMKRIQSQLDASNKEYEVVLKAEEAAQKRGAPRYGLA